MEYSEVRAYLYNPGDNRKNLILQKGKLHPEVVNPEGIKLTAGQVAQLLKAIYHSKPDRSGSGCFLPHHGIVFYDQNGKPVADISICFLCEVVVEEPAGANTLHWDREALAKLMPELGLPVFKDLDEANAHFTALARKWPDAKLKAALDECIFRKPDTSPREVHDRTELLQGVGERTHPFLLAYLADKGRRAEWLTKADPSDPFSKRPFHWLCDLFGDAPPAAVVPLLAGFLDEQEDSVRCDAAETIAKTGAAEIIPLVRKALADPSEYTGISALEGLLAASNRGPLHPEVKAQLFDDVRKLEPDSEDTPRWVKVLLGLDREKAMAFFLSDEVLRQNTRDSETILNTFCDLNVEIPRQHLLNLIMGGQAADANPAPTAAFLLLGRRHHPDDLGLLQQMTKTDNDLARSAMSGLLAWHGLEGYRRRLEILEDKKGFAALDEAQRFHFAVDEFASSTMNIAHYFASSEGEHWQTTLAGLRAMKQDEMASALEGAAGAFGEEANSPDPEARQKRYMSPRNIAALMEFDEQRHKLESSCDLALDRYAIEHAESFK
ncbi:DUF4375 domain-containing protein [Haloferula sp. BvORR071]|uniref:DMP19 family protein n=1 Tax=Haloferula sp. BvORR071 TaxID=1396141 RepID=UPI0006960ABF|nr:DUF4375 domain-containing protein [Haloferula sp. BvORR071]